MYNAQQNEATVLIIHLRKHHRYSNKGRKVQSKSEWSQDIF